MLKLSPVSSSSIVPSCIGDLEQTPLQHDNSFTALAVSKKHFNFRTVLVYKLIRFQSKNSHSPSAIMHKAASAKIVTTKQMVVQTKCFEITINIAKEMTS